MNFTKQFKKGLTEEECNELCLSLQLILQKINSNFTVEFEATSYNQATLVTEGTFTIRSIGIYWRNIDEVNRVKKLWIETI